MTKQHTARYWDGWTFQNLGPPEVHQPDVDSNLSLRLLAKKAQGRADDGRGWWLVNLVGKTRTDVNDLMSEMVMIILFKFLWFQV